uniref:Uncharacterized protein n=1 Tax=Anguilla anguilla TaxID=7936 RepID=A0A0E9VUK0_ANGAN
MGDGVTTSVLLNLSKFGRTHQFCLLSTHCLIMSELARTKLLR